MKLSRSISYCVAGCLLLTTGEGNPALAAQPSFTIRDSAGVRIVVNSGPAWSSEAEYRIGARPVLKIGTVEGDPHQMFEQVRGVTRMDDGTIVVLEGGTNELRLFDAGGNFVRNLGGTGDGPGEFRFLTEMWVSGDTIFGFCNARKRISVFGRDGQVLANTRIEVAEGAGNPAAKGHFSDGTLLVLSAPSGVIPMTQGVFPGASWRLDRFSRSGRFINEIAFVKESNRWGHEISGLPPGMYLPLSLGIGPYAARDAHVHTGDPTEGSIERWGGDGDLTRVIRWPTPELRVTARQRSRYRVAHAEPPQGVNPASWNRYLDETPFPDRMPAYSRLLVDALGNLWAERYRPSWEEGSSWYVFDERGVWLGELPTPHGLRIFEIGADHVLGLERDELGLPFVVMFPLARAS